MIESRSFDIVAYIDGGSRGNPGPAGYGVVVLAGDGSPVDELSGFIGRATNNSAEYRGLLAALDYAIEHGHRRLKVRSDSELLVRQLQGVYRVKSADLAPLYQKARERIFQLDAFAAEHIPRELNGEADRLANLAMDRGKSGELDERSKSNPVKSKAAGAADAVLRVRATYRQGVLKPEQELPLAEGEEVEVKITRA